MRRSSRRRFGGGFDSWRASGQGAGQIRISKSPTINAGLEVDAAHQSVLAGQDERRDFWRKVASVKGQQVAAMAANGIDVGLGAGQRTQDDTQLLANDDAKHLYSQIEERTKGHYIDASNYRSQGSQREPEARQRSRTRCSGGV
jgi:hypothetical protein